MSKPERIDHSAPARTGIRWTAVIFAFAANLLLFTLTNALAGLVFGEGAILWASIIGPVIAGALTAIVARQRGGIHAFLGGAATVPIIVWLILPGAWRTAIFAACFCTMGGALTEIFLRRR